jgi:outer membrane protein OmpA-like peptidoglycan-associated protein
MGLRLHLDKSTKITLVGTNSYTGDEKGNMQLSRNRAMSVKNYFVDIWEIEPDRIDIKARHLPEEPSNAEEVEGQEENRRVEILSDDWRITEPVIAVDTTRNINRTTLRFYPKVKAETGLRSWEIIIKQEQNVIKDFSGTEVIPDSISWELSSDSPESQLFGENMTYSLVVEDGIGQFAATSDKKLAVEQMTIERKKIEKKLDREYEFYSLIIFEFGKSTLRGEHKKVVDVIKQRLKPNSKVIITGHTDIMGKEQLNKRIATKRATSVAKHLNIPDTQIIGIGQENLLYDNALPEGRFYCRTVRITIETAIENK